MPRQRRIRDGYDYETYVAQALKRRGFRSIEQTAKSGDYGVDLLARCHGVRYAIQCKYYTDPVGGFAVQEAVAGMGFYGCDRAMVVTNSCLTKAGRELAEANDVEVLEYIAPEHERFWERRQPWELVLLALECVLFGLVLHQMVLQQAFQWKSVGILALLCFPLPYLAIWLGRIALRLFRRGLSGRAPDSEPPDV